MDELALAVCQELRKIFDNDKLYAALEGSYLDIDTMYHEAFFDAYAAWAKAVREQEAS